jgi:MFS family permease
MLAESTPGRSPVPQAGVVDGTNRRVGLLRGSPPLRALCASRAVSFVGDGITTTVLTLLVAQRDGPGGVAVLLLAGTLPRFLGPLAGVLADRVETRRLMATCELASALVVAVVAVLLPPQAVLAPLVALAAAIATVRGPAGQSLVPALVAEEDRAPANALFGMAGTLQLALGPGLGGLLAAGPGGLHAALAVDAATFAVSALLLLRLPRLVPARIAPGGLWSDASAGLRYVAAHRSVVLLVISMFVLVAFAAMDNVALVFLTDDLGAGTAGYGFAAGAFGVGMLAAAAACARWARGRSAGALIVLAVVVTGIGTALTGFAPLLAVVLAGQLVAGMGNAGENTGLATVVQSLVPREYLGRVFGTVGTAAQLGSGVAYSAGGWLVATAGARTTFVVAGLGTFAVLLALVPALRGR